MAWVTLLERRFLVRPRYSEAIKRIKKARVSMEILIPKKVTINFRRRGVLLKV
jgi:hypothetical protein